MTETIICTILTCICSIVVSALGIIQSRNAKKSAEEKEKEKAQNALEKADEAKRAERRQKESRLSLDMIFSTMELANACCNALCGGHNNGNVEVAKQKAESARKRYVEFEREILIEETSI